VRELLKPREPVKLAGLFLFGMLVGGGALNGANPRGISVLLNDCHKTGNRAHHTREGRKDGS
jgi:hypothetical protein